MAVAPTFATTLGQRVILAAEWKNDAGALTNPATVTLDILTPEDVALSPALIPTNPSTGVYEATLPLTASGQWAYRWTALGNGVDQVLEGLIDVGGSPFGGADAYDDQPGTNLHDELRLRLGDIDQAAPLFTEAQLAWLLTRSNDDMGAAVLLGARVLRARAARGVDVAEGDVRRSGSQEAKGLVELIGELQGAVAAAVAPIPLAGGLLHSEAAGRDPDLVAPYFTTSEPFPWSDDVLRRLA